MDEDSEYWEDSDTRIHEVELIMKLTADYVLPGAEDNGVPSNGTIGLNNQPYDFAQGYGIVNAEKAIALALTLEELRRADDDITVMDAYYRYFNITTKGSRIDSTNVLATSWIGDWSMFTDPTGVASPFTTKHPRSIFVHNKTSRIIVDLAYDPLSTTELTGGTLTLVIDYNGDGSIDWRGDSSFSSDGIKHDEIDIGGGGAETGQYWEFNVEGRAANIPRITDPTPGANEFNEAIIEYSVSVQMVFDIAEGEIIYYDSGDLHAKVAQPEFGEPTQEYQGNGSIEMATYFYDLTKVYQEEAPQPKKSTEGGFPWWIILILAVLVGLLGYVMFQKKKTQENVTFAQVEVVQPQKIPITGEIVEAEVISEPVQPIAVEDA
jgi:hypothetical protein